MGKASAEKEMVKHRRSLMNAMNQVTPISRLKAATLGMELLSKLEAQLEETETFRAYYYAFQEKYEQVCSENTDLSTKEVESGRRQV